MDKIEKARELFKKLESIGKEDTKEDSLRKFLIRDRLLELKN